MNSQIIPLLVLLHTRGLGRARIWKLIEQFGSAERVIEEGWDRQKRLLFGKWEVLQWEKDLEAVESAGVKLIDYEDPLYPKNLLTIPDFPLLLYVKGDLVTTDSHSIALIGTRNATLYGKQLCEAFAREMGRAGVCVVSGLARGIDTAAHEGALASGGRTLAVLGSGLSKLYPQENRALAERIASSGCLLSEFPMETAPAKGLFPQRNRIVSGISQGVCLMESPSEGGGMLTMEIAARQNRALFALPGRVDWPTFAGNHYLIKGNKARLVESGNELLGNLKIAYKQELTTPSTPPLSPEERALLTQMSTQEKSIEELVLLTQLPIMQLNVLLMRLVLKRVIREFPGKIYKSVFTK